MKKRQNLASRNHVALTWRSYNSCTSQKPRECWSQELRRREASVIGIMPQGELWEGVEIQGRFYEDVVSQDLDWHEFMWEPPPTSSHHKTSRGPKKVENKNSGLAVVQVMIGAWAVILSWQCDFTILRILGWKLFMKSQLSCDNWL